MILKWPSQIIDQMVYLDHMGKNRFSKTLKIFLSETTRLIALIFCVLFAPPPPPPPRFTCLHRPWVGLQSVIVVFLDHTHLLFL